MAAVIIGLVLINLIFALRKMENKKVY